MKFDVNQTEDLDHEELKQILLNIAPDLTEKQLLLSFKKFDFNNDGVISYEEFSNKLDQVDW